MSDDADDGSVSLYEAIGGEETIRRLVTHFYDLMDTLPEAKAARAIHGPSLEASREKLFEYLTGWLGGPPLYTSKYGHPRLRARHLHAPIGEPEIVAWLLCFEQALQETVPDARLREAILPPVRQLAVHMGNR
jgi:hemoglobin